MDEPVQPARFSRHHRLQALRLSSYPCCTVVLGEGKRGGIRTAGGGEGWGRGAPLKVDLNKG